MSLQLRLRPEGHVAFLLTLVEGADVMAPCEMGLQGWVGRIVYRFVVVRAQVALEVVPIQVVDELRIVEEVL